eukprot:SAG31_NODE_1794_length_7249_cov_4.709231_7_plen_88_part_00
MRRLQALGSPLQVLAGKPVRLCTYRQIHSADLDQNNDRLRTPLQPWARRGISPVLWLLHHRPDTRSQETPRSGTRIDVILRATDQQS